MRRIRQGIKIETFRGPGPGGQNRNKRDTAVRVTHVLTGLVAQSTRFRTQKQNLRAAFEILEVKLAKKFERKKIRKKTNPSSASKQKTKKLKQVQSEKKASRRDSRVKDYDS